MAGMRIEWLTVRRPGWSAALVFAGLLVVSTPVSAELTVQELVGNSAPGVGPFQQDVADAIKAFAGGDFGAAFGRLQSAKKSTFRLPPAEIMMARLYLDANLPNPAVAMLEQAVRNAKDDPEAMVMLGERAVADGRLTEAGLLFEKVAPAVTAFRANPQRQKELQVRLYTAWSTVDEREGSFDAAQKKLEALVKLDANNATAHEMLGRVLFRTENGGRRAYDEFKAASTADPKRPPAEIAMAALFADKSKAEMWMQAALKNSGKDVRTQLAAGEYRLRANQIDLAKVHADEALKLDPDGLQANLLAGLVARVQSDHAAAVKHLGAAHLAAPADPAIINHLALALVELPDDASRRRALQFAELNAQTNPASIDALATLGWISYRLDRRIAAERALTAAVRASTASRENKVSSDIGYYMAVINKDQGNTAQAIEMLKNALNSNSPFAYRISAEKLLAELEKAEASPDAKTKAASTGGATAPNP